MSWNRQQVKILIQEWSKHPCLYEIKSPQFKNRIVRKKAYEKILEALIKVKEDATIDDIKSKFNGLKYHFVNEHKRHLKSLYTRGPNGRVYTPGLWYYPHMTFLLDHIQAKPTDVMNIFEHATANSEEKFENEDPLCVSESLVKTEVFSLHGSDTYYSPIKRARTDSDDQKLDAAIEAIGLLSSRLANGDEKIKRSKFSSFADFLISKMEQLPDESVNEVQEEMMGILFKALKRSKQ